MRLPHYIPIIVYLNIQGIGIQARTLQDGTSSNFQSEIQLSSDLIFRYGLVNVPEGGGPATSSPPYNALSVEMVYRQLGWVGFAIAADERGEMPGGEAIIGVLNEAQSKTNPGKYHMSSRSSAGVQLMEDSKQTLMDASISQDSSRGETILAFTKFLQEPGELTINGTEDNANNTFLWGHAPSAALGYHAARSSFKVDLASGLSQESAAPAARNYRGIFVAHAVMAGVAWLFTTPVAVAAAWLRHIFASPKDKAWWFKTHYALNSATILLTVISFILAVVSKFQQDPKHQISEHKHYVTGWVIAFVACAQATGGYFRPHVPGPKTVDDTRDVFDRADVSRASADTSGAASAATSAVSDMAISGDASRSRSPQRRIWEYGHKLLGVGLIIVAIWQCFTGLVLFQEIYGAETYVNVLWVWVGAFFGLVFVLKIWSAYQRFSKSYMRDAEGDSSEL